MGQINLSITPTSVTKYYTIGDDERFRNSVGLKHEELKNRFSKVSCQVANNKRDNNELSPRARKRIRNSVNWLAYLSGTRESKYFKGKSKKPFSLGFWTLTLPSKQMHSHKEIKSKCLNNFFNTMRSKFHMKNYIWVAELQSNGNIHFHITTDIYVHYMEIRRVWNKSLELLGYVSEYQQVRQTMSFVEYSYWRNQSGTRNKAKILKSYNHGKNTRWRDPNTVDIKSVKNIKSMGAYLAKYISKNTGVESKPGPFADSLSEFEGRLWFLSQSLSKLGTVKLYMCMKYRNMFDLFRKLRDAFIVQRDFIEMIFFNMGTIPKMLKEFLREELVSHAIDTGYHFQCSINSIGR